MSPISWQLRCPETIDCLGAALSDPDLEVWKEALDGLVAIGGPSAVRWIQRPKEQVRNGEIHNGLSLEWLVEALEQLEPREATN